MHRENSAAITTCSRGRARRLLVNLDNLQAMPNPTEPGSRAWFFMTAGGEAYQFNKSPLPLESTRLCGAEPLTDYRISRSVTMLGVVIPPGESAAVVAAEGEHAGAYTFENVNWTDIGHAGGDATDEISCAACAVPTPRA